MEGFAPWAAVIIFLLMFILIILDKFERHWVTLSCAAAVLIIVFGICLHSWPDVWEVINLNSIFTTSFWIGPSESSSVGINWSTIIFIAGMMVMVEGMAQQGFFRWLCLWIARLVKYRASRIFLAFMVMSFLLAMFIDSITVILFLAAVTVELGKLLHFNPVPIILSEIFCANLGGSATMCGDPPNIIIGTSLHLSFADFIVNTGLLAFVSLFLVMLWFWLCYHKRLQKSEKYVQTMTVFPDPKEAIENKTGFIVSAMIFLLAIVLLVSHAQTGLTVAFIGAFIALVTLLAAGKHVPELLKQIDYKTLLFFIGLFVVVGGLEETDVLTVIADLIARISGGNMVPVVLIIIWVSAAASAFVDNIPFSAVMVPVIRTLSAVYGLDLNVLAWTLSMGTDIGGSATPIGASANVVGTAVAMKNGYPISWKSYMKTAVPATILVISVSSLLILIRYVWI